MIVDPLVLKERLIEHIKAKPISQRELARQIGISPITLGRFLKDGKIAYTRVLLLINKYLNEI